MRKSIKIDYNPRTTAACLNNIKRTLSYLRKSNNKIDPNYLYIHDEILQGIPRAIVNYFNEVAKGYQNQIRNLEKQKYLFF